MRLSNLVEGIDKQSSCNLNPNFHQTEEEESDATNKLTSQLKLLSRKRHQKARPECTSPTTAELLNREKAATFKPDAKSAYEEKRALSRMY